MGRKTDIAEKFAKYLRGNMNDGLAIVINKETTHIDLLDIDDDSYDDVNFNQLQVKMKGDICQFLSSTGDHFVGFYREYNDLLKIEKFIDIMNSHNIKTVVI